MKSTIIGALSVLCLTLTCFAARDKGGLGPQTDFKNMPPEQVLALLQDAGNIQVKMPKSSTYSSSYDLKACNGDEKAYVTRESYCATIIGGDWKDPDVLLGDMEALFRGCGFMRRQMVSMQKEKHAVDWCCSSLP